MLVIISTILKKINKRKLLNKLHINGVETRPIISGDFSRSQHSTNIKLKNKNYIKMQIIFTSMVFILVYIQKNYQIKI